MEDQSLSFNLESTYHHQNVALVLYAILPGSRLELSKYLLQNIKYSLEHS